MAGDPAATLGTLSSLTGGGGLSASSSASSSSGPSSIGFNQEIGGLNINSSDNRWLWAVVLVVVVLLGWLLWQQFK